MSKRKMREKARKKDKLRAKRTIYHLKAKKFREPQPSDT